MFTLDINPTLVKLSISIPLIQFWEFILHITIPLHRSNMYKDVYAVFYKDGKLVELMTARSKSAYGLKDYTTVDVDFDLGQIDWDDYQLYL